MSGRYPARIVSTVARGVSTATGPSNWSIRSAYPAGVQRYRLPSFSSQNSSSWTMKTPSGSSLSSAG